MEDNNDDVRAFDNNYQDTLISSSIPPFVSQNYTANTFDDQDELTRLAIEESIQMYEKEVEQKKKNEEMERMREEEEKRKKKLDEERCKERFEKFRQAHIRLKTFFKEDNIAKDVIEIIDWECTPIHLLKSYRPSIHYPKEDIRNWIQRNLPDRLANNLYELSYFL